MELTIQVNPVERTVRLREVRALAAGDSCSVVLEGVRGADASALRLALYRDAASDSPVASCPSFAPVRGHPNLATGDLRLDTAEMAAWFEAVRPEPEGSTTDKDGPRPGDTAERAVRTDGWLVVSEPTRTWAACRVPVVLRPGAGASGVVDPTSIQSLVEGLVSAAMSEALASKADKATTLAGYGITDAATKSELESVSHTAGGAMSLATETHTALSSKADKANVYTKEDVDSRYSALSSQIGDIGNSTNILSTTIDQHIRDTNNPHKVTAAQVGALPLTGGTLTGDLSVGKSHTESRTLHISSDITADGITLHGGGNGSVSSVDVGGSIGEGGNITVNGGGTGGGTILVGGSPYTGGKLTVQGGGKSGGSIEVTEAGASIKKNGKEVATEEQLNAKADKATTLAGYGITDAATKTELNAKADKSALAAKADKATTLAGYGITDAATKSELESVSHTAGGAMSLATETHTALSSKADLVDGKVPADQLPSYVDDVLEYDSVSAFPSTGEDGKIYVAKDTNKTYRWGGTQYVEISQSLALGETSETAYPGDKGKAAAELADSAYTVASQAMHDTAVHAENTNNPHKVTAAQVGALPISGGTLTGDLKVGTGINLLNATDKRGGRLELMAEGGGDGQDPAMVYIGPSKMIGGLLYLGGGVSSGGTATIFGKTGVDEAHDGGSVVIEGGDFYNGARIMLMNNGSSMTPTEDGPEITIGEVKVRATLAAKADKATTLAGYGITDAATMESIAPEYSPSSAYAVGSFVYHDGNIYQCTTAIADGGEAWNAAHWELRKLDDFFTESNSLLTGLIESKTRGKADQSDLDALAAKVDTANAALEEVA